MKSKAAGTSETPAPLDFQSLRLLSVKEFAQSVGIGRTKLFEMKKSEVLIKGRHYFQHGRKILFPWGPEFLERFLAECCGEKMLTSRDMVAQAAKPSRELAPKGGRTQHKTAMDTAYCMSD